MTGIATSILQRNTLTVFCLRFNPMKKTLIEALKSAGEIQCRSFQAVRSIAEKESISSVVTEVDIESESKIIGVIENNYPGHNILSEEYGFKNRPSAYTWVIDPLDGTSNYAAGLPATCDPPIACSTCCM